MKYPHLFEPLRVGNVLYRNRIFSAPTGNSDVLLGRFTDDAIAVFEHKAKGGAAVVLPGEAVVDSVYGKSYPSELSLDSRQPAYGLSKLADRISRHGAVPSLELQHHGMKATPGVVTPGVGTSSNIVFGPSACTFRGVEVQEMPEEVILEVIEKFANAAKLAQNCGFGMVLVHGGHGWLVNQFMNEHVNHRTDKWGGSMENRARLAIEICDAIHRACGRGFPVEMRISSVEGYPGGYQADYAAEFAALLEGHADIIHCSAGGFPDPVTGESDMNVVTPGMFKEQGVNIYRAETIKKRLQHTPLAVVGALSDPAFMEDVIASGKADIVEVARGLICDPDLPNKARSGRDDEIRRCMRCNCCFSNAMQRGATWCAINPEIGREHDFAQIAVTPVKREKVLVVGGGIAGMEAALTAARNGHEVILCEKSDCLGGHIRCEENVPFKKELSMYLRQQAHLVEKAGVEIRLNTTVTPEYAKSVGADTIIAALGARPVVPPIPGIDGSNVVCADDAFAKPELVSDRAVILGGGLVGLELAIYLHGLGKQVEIVEMLPKINNMPNFLLVGAVEQKLREEKIPVHLGTKALRIDANGVDCENADGPVRYEAGTVIYALGQRALAEETAALHDCATYFCPVGDCVQPRNIAEATAAARIVAEDIGRK